MSNSKTYILTALRTPMGRYGGALKNVRPDDLAGHLVKEAVARSGIDPAVIDDVILGCANQSGEDNRNVARMAALLAGLPYEVPGATVNRLCASGLEAVAMASRAIAAGEAEVVVAGGVECMTRAPFAMAKPSVGFPRGNGILYDTALGWRFENPAMARRFPLEGLGVTAENVVEKHAISRDAQDRFALRSHQRAVAAEAAGRFTDEIVAVTTTGDKGEPVTVAKDEGPRADTSIEKLAKLKPAFKDGGTVTAGNSSPLSDGAAALVLASEAACRRLGKTPLACFAGAAAAGVHPSFMGLGPVPATEKLFARTGVSWKEIDLVELNEAFAGQCLGVFRGWEMPDDVVEQRVNVNGGGIALGHPLGCSGARLVVALVHELRRRGARRGLATLCVGVGQGVSAIVEAGL
ncbi:MAG: acetyl-CoA C-acyltransferase [bacterium]